MNEIKTHYIVVSDDAPSWVVGEAVHLKDRKLEWFTDLNEVKVINQSEMIVRIHEDD